MKGGFCGGNSNSKGELLTVMAQENTDGQLTREMLDELCADEPIKKWACPKCKGTKLRVVIESWAELFQNEDGEVETSTDDSLFHEWTENSPMECSTCGHSAISEEFEVTNFQILASFGGEVLDRCQSEADAHSQAKRFSMKRPVDVWTTTGGMMGLGERIAHYNEGMKS